MQTVNTICRPINLYRNQKTYYVRSVHKRSKATHLCFQKYNSTYELWYDRACWLQYLVFSLLWWRAQHQTVQHSNKRVWYFEPTSWSSSPHSLNSSLINLLKAAVPWLHSVMKNNYFIKIWTMDRAVMSKSTEKYKETLEGSESR